MQCLPTSRPHTSCSVPRATAARNKRRRARHGTRCQRAYTSGDSAPSSPHGSNSAPPQTCNGAHVAESPPGPARMRAKPCRGCSCEYCCGAGRGRTLHAVVTGASESPAAATRRCAVCRKRPIGACSSCTSCRNAQCIRMSYQHGAAVGKPDAPEQRAVFAYPASAGVYRWGGPSLSHGCEGTAATVHRAVQQETRYPCRADRRTCRVVSSPACRSNVVGLYLRRAC